jgi:hypothetical protein
MAFQSFLANIHIGAASGWEIFMIVAGLILVFVFGYLIGKNRLLLLMVSGYFSYLILLFLPWSQLQQYKWLGIGSSPAPSLKILVFLVLVFFFFLFIPRSVLSSVMKLRNRGEASWLQILVLSIFQVGLYVCLIISFFPQEAAKDIPPLVAKIFMGQGQMFLWIALPIFATTLLRKQKKQDE